MLNVAALFVFGVGFVFVARLIVTGMFVSFSRVLGMAVVSFSVEVFEESVYDYVSPLLR